MLFRKTFLKMFQLLFPSGVEDQTNFGKTNTVKLQMNANVVQYCRQMFRHIKAPLSW